MTPRASRLALLFMLAGATAGCQGWCQGVQNQQQPTPSPQAQTPQPQPPQYTPQTQVVPLVQTQTDITDIPLAIRVHTMSYPALALTDAEGVAGIASGFLQSVEGPDDTACNVKLSVVSLDQFSIGTGTIYTQFDFDQLFGPSSTVNAAGGKARPPLVRQVRIVPDIRWCGYERHVAGCADEPGLRIVLERQFEDREAELWAHETGHTRGLPHRNSWTAVMHEGILPDHRRLDSTECGHYR